MPINVLKIMRSVFKIYLTLSIGLLPLFLGAQDNPQNVPVIGFTELSEILSTTNDTTYVVNFWATWCIPCVKELPEFEKLNNQYINKKFKIILISLDFKKDLQTRLIPFIKDKKLSHQVYLFSEPDPNSWIPKIDPDWSGAIPATLIFNKHKRVFRESSITFDELNTIVKPLIIE